MFYPVATLVIAIALGVDSAPPKPTFPWISCGTRLNRGEGFSDGDGSLISGEFEIKGFILKAERDNKELDALYLNLKYHKDRSVHVDIPLKWEIYAGSDSYVPQSTPGLVYSDTYAKDTNYDYVIMRGILSDDYANNIEIYSGHDYAWMRAFEVIKKDDEETMSEHSWPTSFDPKPLVNKQVMLENAQATYDDGLSTLKLKWDMKTTTADLEELGTDPNIYIRVVGSETINGMVHPVVAHAKKGFETGITTHDIILNEREQKQMQTLGDNWKVIWTVCGTVDSSRGSYESGSWDRVYMDGKCMQHHVYQYVHE